MSDVDNPPYQNESFPHILHQKEKMETIERGQHRKTVSKEKILVQSPRRQKKRVTLARQDTFNLEKEDELPPKQDLTGGRAKSSYGIKAGVNILPNKHFGGSLSCSANTVFFCPSRTPKV